MSACDRNLCGACVLSEMKAGRCEIEEGARRAGERSDAILRRLSRRHHRLQAPASSARRRLSCGITRRTCRRGLRRNAGGLGAVRRRGCPVRWFGCAPHHERDERHDRGKSADPWQDLVCWFEIAHLETPRSRRQPGLSPFVPQPRATLTLKFALTDPG